MTPKLLGNTRSAGAPEVPASDVGSALPPWPALPGRRQPDLDRVAEQVSDTVGVRAAMVSLVSAAGQSSRAPAGDGTAAGRCRSPGPSARRSGAPAVIPPQRGWPGG